MWRHSSFVAALKHGWDYYALNRAEKALVQRATGYKYEEVTTARVPLYDTIFNEKGTPHKVIIGYEEVVTQRVTKQMAPDTTALMFLLQNRHGQRWRNVRKVEHVTRVEHGIPGTEGAGTPEATVPQLTTAELEAIVAVACRVGLLPAQGAQGTNRAQGAEGVVGMEPVSHEVPQGQG
jgi:hypothetical protein